MKSNVSRRKEIIKIRVGISETENRKSIEGKKKKSMKPKAGSLKRSIKSTNL